MVSIKKISENELYNLILISYRDDYEGLKMFHVTHNLELTEAVDLTWDIIKEESKGATFEYYKVCFFKKPIGYFVTAPGVLYSFCINIKYRTPTIVKAWWAEVEKIFRGRFVTGVYENNTRAINFLKRRGMKVFDTQSNIVKLIKL